MTLERTPAPEYGDGAFVCRPKRVELPSGERVPTMSAMQAADFLGKSNHTVYRWCREGLLEFKQDRPGCALRPTVESVRARKAAMEEVR